MKPRIRKLALERSKEINKSRRGYLNLLYLRQNFLLSSFKKGNLRDLSQLSEVQTLIKKWFEDEASRILTQIDMEDVSGAEAVRIHHHEIHKKKMTQSYILQLETDAGIATGHEECSEILSKNIANILEND